MYVFLFFICLLLWSSRQDPKVVREKMFPPLHIKHTIYSLRKLCGFQGLLILRTLFFLILSLVVTKEKPNYSSSDNTLSYHLVCLQIRSILFTRDKQTTCNLKQPTAQYKHLSEKFYRTNEKVILMYFFFPKLHLLCCSLWLWNWFNTMDSYPK